MSRPTENAQEQFKRAHALLRNAQSAVRKDSAPFQQELARSLAWFYGGCHSLTLGIRAIYILLEKMDKKLEAIERKQRHFRFTQLTFA